MSAQKQSSTTNLKDYAPPCFLIEKVFLEIELHNTQTRVCSTLTLRKNPLIKYPQKELILDGEDFELLSIKINGKKCNSSQYKKNSNHLCLFNPLDSFELACETQVNPKDNKALCGLYLSKGIYCTQNEAEGFRKITYFLDRPDVMSTFTTVIIGDKKTCPYLLSNGNLVEKRDLNNGKHLAKWHDPFKKPCYLYALVAGDLDLLQDHFITQSQKKVLLEIYVQKNRKQECSFAMKALKNAMQWDEKVYGLEYDLQRFMIVAVDDFNMGAMENKGLNIFNSSYILASPESATDRDFINIESIIAHEYFHNWSGNRVTLRDWFQLSLKEGLTVYRDQEFSYDMSLRNIKRIADVSFLREVQFVEDKGPLAHPVRPESYVKIDNFYTYTVYQKGAELIRMLALIVGKQTFQKAMQMYFQRFDGQAICIENLLEVLEESSQKNLEDFLLWYSQTGTPQVFVSSHYDEVKKSLTLSLEQKNLHPINGENQKALPIPISLGLLSRKGEELDLYLDPEKKPEKKGFILLEKKKQDFIFHNLKEKPHLSLLRNFSAPVELSPLPDLEELCFFLEYDGDPFKKWDASFQILCRILTHRIEKKDSQYARFSSQLIAIFDTLLKKEKEDPALLAQILTLPGENYLAQCCQVPIDAHTIHEVREQFMDEIASYLENTLFSIYDDLKKDADQDRSPEAISRRSLKNTCLLYLTQRGKKKYLEKAFEQFKKSVNMTDTLAALSCLVDSKSIFSKKCLDHFYKKWKHTTQVLDKWFSVQALSKQAPFLEKIQALTKHPDFSWENPNKVSCLLKNFSCKNPWGFHQKNANAYAFMAASILKIDKKNPQLSSNLATCFKQWKKFASPYKEKMQKELERLAKNPEISDNLSEILIKSLQG